MNRPYERRRRPNAGRGPRGMRPGSSGSRSRTANSQVVDNTPVPDGLVFYCKTHEKIVDFHPTTFNFKYPVDGCQEAGEKKPELTDKAPRPCEIVYGTERSIKHYYKIPDSKFDAQRRADEERAQRADKL